VQRVQANAHNNKQNLITCIHINHLTYIHIKKKSSWLYIYIKHFIRLVKESISSQIGVLEKKMSELYSTLVCETLNEFELDIEKLN
jgi:hypothetical protein